MNFQPASEMLSPPDSRKRTAQHDKGPTATRNEETFVQPEPPKKHKGVHSTHVAGQDNNQIINTSAQMAPHVQQGGSFLHPDNSQPGSSDDKARLEAVLRDLGQDMKMVYLKWAQPFAEGESFEAFCPARLDELLREALRLEQHLKNQKERLRERLTLITRTLQVPML
ncbi:Testis-expressed sequence 12 protein [Desmophyllum pertusum]|uniref:Testis-expressed sequence 12 protein n=1 Tax=Desmophyllum pertusum TaxID=174260 RepID=A0A9W9ZEV1_9CNID|nr:Testis-expressed sequence 12 protein [Desmophyllum pertusum]